MFIIIGYYKEIEKIYYSIMATMNVIANWSDTETEPKSDSNEFDSLEWDEEDSNKGSDEDSSNE